MVSEKVERAIDEYQAAVVQTEGTGSEASEIAARAALVAAIEAEVGAETVRCANIVQAARFDEVDRDWRSIIALIESNYVHVTDKDEP